MNATFFAKLANPVKISNKSNLNELKVSIDYQKGGTNYFNGRTENGGIYVYFTPVYREGYCCKSVMMGGRIESGFKYLVKPLKRKSQKQIDLVEVQIEPLVNEFANIWGEPNYAKAIVNKIEQAFE